MDVDSSSGFRVKMEAKIFKLQGEVTNVTDGPIHILYGSQLYN